MSDVGQVFIILSSIAIPLINDPVTLLLVALILFMFVHTMFTLLLWFKTGNQQEEINRLINVVWRLLDDDEKNDLMP